MIDFVTHQIKGYYMKEAQMYLINKMFNDKNIRTVWNKEEEKYYISVVDIVESLFVRSFKTLLKCIKI